MTVVDCCYLEMQFLVEAV